MSTLGAPALHGLAVPSASGEPFPATAQLTPGAGVSVDPAEGVPAALARGGALLPGLVNLHDHLRAFLPTGRHSEGVPLTTAITSSSAVQAIAEPGDYQVLTALAAARQAQAGVTSVVDHVYPLHRPGLLEAVVAGHQEVGVRGYVALGIMTRGQPGLCTSVAEIADLAERAADQLLPKEQLYLAPVSLRQNEASDFADAAAAAGRLGLRLYTHIAETPAEVEACLAQHGVRPLELLHRAGFLRPGTVIVHGVQLTDAEIELVAATGTIVAYCPTNHLRFAKGVAPVVDLLRAGATVTLGIDGMESLFHEMRQASYAQGQAAGDPGALGSTEVFEMATAAGARALRLPAGFDGGDLVRLDLTGPQFQPLVDPLWSIVHRAGPGDVTDVIVGGRPIVRDGELVLADCFALAEKAAATTRRLAERAGSPVPDVWDIPSPATPPQ